MQTLCKPPRRVYDTKAIEACHSDPEDPDHDDIHDATSALLSGAAAVVSVTAPGKKVMKFLEGTAAAVFVAEVEETISHAVDDALEWLEERAPDPPNNCLMPGTSFCKPGADREPAGADSASG